jgi:heme-degrading monooxygenase HmoA
VLWTTKSFPRLRKQKGFLDAITLAVPGGREIVSISFWDQEENAKVYNSVGYPEVLEILKNVLAGPPHVSTFDVVSSTLQKNRPPKSFLLHQPGAQVWG